MHPDTKLGDPADKRQSGEHEGEDGTEARACSSVGVNDVKDSGNRYKED